MTMSQPKPLQLIRPLVRYLVLSRARAATLSQNSTFDADLGNHHLRRPTRLTAATLPPRIRTLDATTDETALRRLTTKLVFLLLMLFTLRSSVSTRPLRTLTPTLDLTIDGHLTEYTLTMTFYGYKPQLGALSRPARHNRFLHRRRPTNPRAAFRPVHHNRFLHRRCQQCPLFHLLWLHS